MAFQPERTSLKWTCSCCSKLGHSVVQYEKERTEPGWSFWRGRWVCPHCGQKFFLWKCEHCGGCYFTLEDSPPNVVCCGLLPARAVGRKGERRWYQWILDLHYTQRLHLSELHDPNDPYYT